MTYNSAHVLEGLLDSLPAAMGTLTSEVVVVDNGSLDGTADLAESRHDCTVLRGTNVGYAAGINRGVAAAPPSRHILVLNPDVRLAPGSAEVMRRALDDPRRGTVVPRVLDAEGELTWSLRREPSLPRAIGLGRLGTPLLSEYCMDVADYQRPHAVDWALGAVLMMSRTAYDAVGGWDESYFLYSEETDFLLRARDLGFETWFEPRAVATHIGKQSGYDGVTHSMLILNRVRLYRRRHPAIAAWIYMALTVAGEVAWLVRGQKESGAAITALVRPGKRPAQLGCSRSFLPT